MLLSSLEYFLLCSFGVPKHVFPQEGLACSSAMAKQKSASCLTSGRPKFFHFDRSLFAFLVCPYVLPVSNHVLLLLSAGEGTLSPAMSLQCLAHRVSSLQQGPESLQWPQIFY